jgi:hypothetical protein
MNCLIAAKYNPDNIISFSCKNQSDIWSCIMFVWAFMKDDYFYIKMIEPEMLGFWTVRLKRGLGLLTNLLKFTEEETGAHWRVKNYPKSNR